MKTNTNAIVIVLLTTFVGGLADNWSLLLCAGFGIAVALWAARRFVYHYWKQSVLVLSVGLLLQFFLQLTAGVGFLFERIAFMITPMAFLLFFRWFMLSKYRILFNHKIRMMMLAIYRLDISQNEKSRKQ